MERIAIIGAGELGIQIANIGKNNHYTIIGFFDDFTQEKEINGLPILGKIKDIPYKKDSFDYLTIGIGYKHFEKRKYLFEQLKDKYRFKTIIDKSAFIDPSATIMDGCVIYPSTTIDKNVIIENNVLINLSCTISHDCRIQAHSFLAPSVAIAGFTNVGECCFLGIHSTIIDNIFFPCNSILAAGSCLTKTYKQSNIYIGTPAKPKHSIL